jgi:hypothetical protein
MQCPALSNGFAGSPPGTGGTALFEQTWEIGVEVRYQPNLLQSLNGTEVPSYLSILKQRAGTIWNAPPEEGGSGAGSLTEILEFGRELTLRSVGRSKLLVSSRDSSP